MKFEPKHKTMALKLYFDFLSQPSRALYILFSQCKVPFQQYQVALRKGEHLTDTYKTEVSRFQKVPVIDDNGYKLTESIAILRYIAKEKNLPENWYPSDSKRQARVDEFLEWQHNNLRLNCSMYFQFKYVIPLRTGAEVDEDMVSLFESRMIETLDNMETLWLEGKPFINGDEISAADIWAACEIEQPRIAGYEPRSGRPVLAAWLERVKQKTSPFYEEAHTFLNKLVSKTKPTAKL